MALILAIEPDQRQAAQITGIARHRLNADLILADTTERALDAIGDRVPDLVLIPALLSPQDDAALAAALRVIAAAANVRTLTIPVLASGAPRKARRAVLGRWRKASGSTTPDGCDPAVFAEQVSTYLAEAVAERGAHKSERPIAEPAVIDESFFEPPPAAFEPAPPPIFEPAPPMIFERMAAPSNLELAPSAIFESLAPGFLEPAASPIFVAAPPIIVEPAAASAIIESGPSAVFFEPPASAIIEPTAPAIFEPSASAMFEPSASAILDSPAPAVLEPAASVIEPPVFALDPAVSAVELDGGQNAFAEPIFTTLSEGLAERVVLEPEPAIEEPIVADFAIQPPAVVEPTTLAFQPTASTPDEIADPGELADPISSYVAEAIAEHALLEPELEIEEEFIDAAQILAEFDFEPEAAGEATILAFQPAHTPVEERRVNTTADASFDEEERVDEAPDRMRARAGFDASDIIEIDLSDETLEHVADEEPVFELNVEDGAGAFAIEETSPYIPFSPAADVTPAVEAAEFFAQMNLEQPHTAPDLELWMPLSVGAAHLWPAMEGVASEFVDPSAVPVATPAAPKSEHPEWTELIASLRQDMERRRDAVEPTPITRVVPRRKSKPVQDEWGFFDPQQCGFAALLAKLDEITEASDEQPASRLA